MLVADVDIRNMNALVEQLRSAVTQPLQLERRVFNLDVSIGYARYPHDVKQASELFNATSIALHHAKRRDNSTCPYTQAMHHALQRRHLGDWVLEESARQLMAWGTQNKQALPGRLSINISAQQFADPELTQHIAQLMAGVPPNAISLELTESDFMRDPDQAVEITHTMRKAGYALSIDDFGTGYSSLSYLRRFAADALKIDISFVREMLDNHHDRTIVQTIIAMAKALEMKTVAEGVETRAQARLLADMGCNEAQGYWFGRPLPANEFAAAWLNK